MHLARNDQQQQMMGVGDGGEGSKACLRTSKSLVLDALSFPILFFLVSLGIYGVASVWTTQYDRDLESKVHIKNACHSHWNLPIADVPGEGRWQSLCGFYNRDLSHGNAFHAAILCVQFVFALTGKRTLVL